MGRMEIKLQLSVQKGSVILYYSYRECIVMQTNSQQLLSKHLSALFFRSTHPPQIN